MKTFFQTKIKPVHIIIVAVLTLLMLGFMDIYTLPRIAREAGGIAAFDLHTFGYSHQTACDFLSQLSQSGRQLFLHVQLPVDFAFAFVYTFLFFALYCKLYTHGDKLCIFPALLFVMDIAENTLSVVFLRAKEVSPALTTAGSAITFTKNILTLICAVIAIVLVVRYFIQRKKQGTE